MIIRYGTKVKLNEPVVGDQHYGLGMRGVACTVGDYNSDEDIYEICTPDNKILELLRHAFTLKLTS